MYCNKCGHVELVKSWRSKYPLWLQMLFAFCLSLPLGGVLYYNFFQAMPAIAKAELEALHNREYSKAFYAYTASKFQGKSDLIDFREFLAKNPILMQYESCEIDYDSLDAKKGKLEVKLVSAKGGEYSALFRFQRENLNWKITKIGLDGDYFPYDDEVRQEIEQTIQGQLTAIKNGDVVDAYYTYTGRDFQSKTSLGSFQEMVEFFAPLRSFEKAEFLDTGRDKWKVGLHADGSVSEMVFHLSKEKGTWKISAMEFCRQGDLPVDPEGIILSQLAAIRAHEIAKAYFDYSSKEFQQSLTLQDFKSFVKKQETFFHHRASKIHSVKQSKNEAVVLATLSSLEDDRHLPVEFELILEDNVWKINHILMN